MGELSVAGVDRSCDPWAIEVLVGASFHVFVAVVEDEIVE